MFSLGTYLLLQRRLSRLVIGLGLLGHGANLLLLFFAGSFRPGLLPLKETSDLNMYTLSSIFFASIV